MLSFIRVPYEGCLWRHIEVISAEEFMDAVQREPKPCALGWAYEWTGEGEYYRPVGLVYDYVIQRTNERHGTAYNPWRMIGQ